MPRAAIVGNLVLDVVAGAPERPGGMVWYCARALSEIDPDADVVLVCRSAAEDRDALVPRLEEFGFPVHWQAAERTTRFSFHYEGDRRIMAIDSLAEPWTPADIDGWVGDVIGDAPWVIVGALTRADFPLETLAALTARGHGLVVDAQGLVRHGQVGPLVSDGRSTAPSSATSPRSSSTTRRPSSSAAAPTRHRSGRSASPRSCSRSAPRVP